MITISYDFGNDWWVISDSSNELEDEIVESCQEVEETVKTMQRQLQKRGYDTKVKWPRLWPPDDDDLDPALDSAPMNAIEKPK